MTKKLAISVPDDVAEWLKREPNVSAFITGLIRQRMVATNVRRKLEEAGFEITDEGIARAREERERRRAAITPELRREAAELRARIASGRA